MIASIVIVANPIKSMISLLENQLFVERKKKKDIANENNCNVFRLLYLVVRAAYW